MKTFAIISLLFFSTLGCRVGTPSTTKLGTAPKSHAKLVSFLTIHDSKGVVLATGHLTLPDPLPGEGGKFEGIWTLDSSTKDFPSDATSPGQYSAQIYQGEAIIDLNPDMADHNVMLAGKMSNGVLHGICWRSGIEGRKTLGTFIVDAADSHAH